MLSPNFFIIGAPKCGTSSIFYWLALHPEVEASSPKETFFLMDQDSPLLNKQANLHVHGAESYRLFFNSKTDANIQMEATTHYYHQSTPLEFIAGLNNKKVLFIKRNPVERIYSSFNYTKNNKAEVAMGLTFSKYVEYLLTSPNSLEKYFVEYDSYYVLSNELFYSEYEKFIFRWKERLSSSEFMVLDFIELSRDPKNAIYKICTWLKIDPEFYNDFEFERNNKSISIRNPWLHRKAKEINNYLPNGLKGFGKHLYYKLQVSQNDNRKLQDEVGLKALRDYFSGITPNSF